MSIITKFQDFITEGYKDVDELSQLADDIFIKFSKMGDDFLNEYENDNQVCIEGNLTTFANPNEYSVLKDFINEFEFEYISFEYVDNKDFKGAFIPNEEKKHVFNNKGGIVINPNINNFNINLNKNKQLSKIKTNVLYKTLTETFKTTLVHELQHAFDYYRSSGNFSKSKKTDRYEKMVNDIKLSDTSSMSKDVENLYNNLTHEQWGRFTGAVSEIDFNDTFENILSIFKSKFRKYDNLSVNDKKRINKALYKYYDDYKNN